MRHEEQYKIGPRYGTPHLFNQMRRVYRLGEVTVYLDRERDERPKRCELFAFRGDGPLWCLGTFMGYSWAKAEQRAWEVVREWMEK